MNSFTSIFQGFCWNYDLSIFFYPLFRNTYFKEHLLLSGYCCNIVSNILIIKKSKEIFSFSQKHLAKNRTFLSENFKGKVSYKIWKAKSAMKNFQKKNLLTFTFLFSFSYFLIIYFGWKGPASFKKFTHPLPF